MPMKKGKNKRHEKGAKGGRGDAVQGFAQVNLDVSVNDYANSQNPRKAFPRRVNMRTIVKEHTDEVKNDDRAWDEKEDDEDGDDLEPYGSGGEEVAEDKSKDRKKRREKHQNNLGPADFVEYPIDIWFLISEKIQPEDVGRFAAICQSTYYVVSTARFWFALYKKHYSLKANLPESLTYHNMDNIRGLKSAVIRSLFYMYAPFKKCIASEKHLSGHPTKLIGAECSSQWHTSAGNFHKYYFMFFKQVKRKQWNRNMQNLLNLESDSLVHVNPDEGCYILETISSGICHFPMVMGNHLHSGHLGLSQGFCSHRLQLTLGPEYLIPKSGSGTRHRCLLSTEIFHISLEPVRDVRIYPWWHPKFKDCLPTHVGNCSEEFGF